MIVNFKRKLFENKKEVKFASVLIFERSTKQSFRIPIALTGIIND